MFFSSHYSDKLNDFIKDSISHQNSLKMNNFDKKNKSFAEALKGKENNRSESNETVIVQPTKESTKNNKEKSTEITDNKTEKQIMAMLI